ncbi:MAG: ATP-binding protein [Lentisphaerae bacterium]|nr:ATP-binding protein [Lentisphaerota bacterium]
MGNKSSNGNDSLEMGEMFYKSVFEAIPYILIIVDSGFEVKALNPAAEEFFGSWKNIESCELWAIAPFLLDSKPAIEKVFASGKTEMLRRIEYKGAEDKYIDVSICPYFTGYSCRGVVILIDDVSELEKKEQYIRRSQKMDLVGTLAAGLSHDFNNVINGIKATAESIAYTLKDKSHTVVSLRDQVRDDMEIIEDSAKRGADIVEQLLSISRKKEHSFARVDLVAVVGDVLKVCGTMLPKTVEIIPDVKEETAMVNASMTQLEQALLNLCINASHAMTIMKKEGEEQGGTLGISLEKIYVGPNMCEFIPDAVPGFYWILSVSDTGIGMTKEVIAKIFDPFFSTKEKRGTGLGLSMVYNTVRESKGFIDVFSEPGNGSVFFVFLPLADKPD